MALVLDAGGLIAVDRLDRATQASYSTPCEWVMVRVSGSPNDLGTVRPAAAKKATW